jgi:hypothetical protein
MTVNGVPGATGKSLTASRAVAGMKRARGALTWAHRAASPGLGPDFQVNRSPVSASDTLGAPAAAPKTHCMKRDSFIRVTYG